MTSIPHGDQADNRSLRGRWGDLLGAGYVAVPALLRLHAAEIKLDPLDRDIVITLVQFSRGHESFVSTTTLATMAGTKRRVIQARIRRMVARGLLARVNGKSPSSGRLPRRVSFLPLIERVQALVRQHGTDTPEGRQRYLRQHRTQGATQSKAQQERAFAVAG